MIIRYDLHICLHCFQANVPSISLPTANLRVSGLKRCRVHRNFAEACISRQTQCSCWRTYFIIINISKQWLLPTQGFLLPQYMMSSLDVWLFSDLVIFSNCSCNHQSTRMVKIIPTDNKGKRKKKKFKKSRWNYYVNPC